MLRRTILRALGTVPPLFVTAGCAVVSGGPSSPVLTARPGGAQSTLPDPGTHPLGVRRDKRDALLYVPKTARKDGLNPLVLYLHGAGGSEDQGIKRMGSYAEEFGFVLLSPASQGQTWDAIRDGYGPDIPMLDQALVRSFATCRIDPRKIAVAGFSDGASYALGLGTWNGDLFTSTIGFSPGFIPPASTRAKKNATKSRIFVSHGTDDQILPIDSCSRQIVPELKRSGYDLTYREFQGPHTVPKDVASEAFRWFLG
jgi:phospholipase/carboxylesterase